MPFLHNLESIAEIKLHIYESRRKFSLLQNYGFNQIADVLHYFYFLLGFHDLHFLGEFARKVGYIIRAMYLQARLQY
jgi:hypothetical protein